MISPKNKVALVLKNKEEVDFFSGIFNDLGYKDQTHFTSADKALEVALRVQFQFFVLRLDMPEVAGVIFIQKLRETGNYGLETYLLIGERLEPAQFNILYEFDVPYVLLKPFSLDRILKKMEHLVKSESSLSETEAKYREARAALTGGITEMALEMAKELVKIKPDSDKYFVLLGDTLLANKDNSNARSMYEKALEINPNCAAAAHKIAHTYVLEKNFAKVVEITNTLTEINPYNIQLLTNAGLSNYEIGNYSKAHTLASKMKKLDKTSKPSSEILAKVNIKKGKYKEAVEALSDSHSQKDLVVKLNNGGIMLAKEGKIKEALDMYETCFKQCKDNEFIYSAYFNVGLIMVKEKRYDEAIPYLKKSLEIKPDFEKAIQVLKKLNGLGKGAA